MWVFNNFSGINKKISTSISNKTLLTIIKKKNAEINTDKSLFPSNYTLQPKINYEKENINSM